MNPKQLEAKRIICDGHNLVLIGQGGTGKTYTIRKCVDLQRSAGKYVTLTCYTGIACMQYGSSMNAMTLHRFAGLEDGRHRNQDLVNLILHDERFEETKKRILKTDILIIDEVSMVSKRILEQVELVCRSVRGVANHFGGIQVVLCGDFYQLPPIKDEMYGDFGHFCFENPFFSDVFPHVLKLTDVHRQTEEILTDAVNKLETGNLTPETISFIESLSRPISVATGVPVKLFCRNIDVDIYNFSKLTELPDQLHVFTSEDEGDAHYLNKFLAQKHFGVKTMAPVMLLKNISDKLVNGLIGKVVKISEDTIYVEFCDGTSNEHSTLASITRCNFTKYDPVHNVCVAKRYQFPLKLAYSLTIHKSQGMTLPLVDIDCKNASQAGQIGVAVGRAQSTDGLRVVNFKPSLCKKHPPEVYKFCESSCLGELKEDLHCCVRSNVKCQPEIEEVAEYFQSDSDFNDELDFSENCIKVVCDMEEHNYSKQTSEETDKISQMYLESGLEDFMETPEETRACAARDKINQNKSALNEWISDQRKKVQDMMEISLEEVQSVKQRNLSEFYRLFNAHLKSPEYLQSVKKVVTDPMGVQLLTSVMFVIQKDLLKEKAAGIELNTDECLVRNIMPSAEGEIGASGRGKIRYVGGYTLAKCKYHVSRGLRNCLFAPGMEGEVKQLQCQLQIIDCLTVTASEITESSMCEETLEETIRKQNISEGLTNIDDRTFHFFELLEKKIRALMTYEKLLLHNRHLFAYVQNELLQDVTLTEEFCHCYCYLRTTVDEKEEDLSDETIIFQSGCRLVERCVSLEVILKKIINLFLSVYIGQFRHNYLVAIRREKGKALRKKVLDKQSKSTTHQKLNFQFILDDKSDSKIVSHLKLKTEVLQNRNFSREFNKTELITILKCYGLSFTKRRTKDEIVKAIHKAVNEHNCMPNHACLDKDSPGGHSKQDSEQQTTTSNESQDVSTSGATSSAAASVSYSEEMETNSDIQESTCNTLEPGPSTSHTSRKSKKTSSKSHDIEHKGKGKGKGKGRKRKKHNDRESTPEQDLSSEKDTTCGICAKLYKDSGDWICCDVCTLWYHRNCVALDKDEDWDAVSDPDAMFTCPMCL